MKIKTLESLSDKLDAEFAWRRKELITIRTQVRSADGSNVSTAIRAGVLMLYAHWEGFVKNVCEYYLIFVSNRRLKYSELNDSFVAIAFKKQLNECQATNKSTIHAQTLKFLFESRDERASIPNKGIIDSASNLNSDILREMLATIGIDYSDSELKSVIIDIKLLKNRNEIAHGQYSYFEKKEFFILYDEINSLIESMKEKIYIAAKTEQYKRVV